MRVTDALSRIDAIHEQLTKGEVYRGFQVRGVALAGLAGLLAAAAQPLVVDPDDAAGFVYYWLAVAVVCALLAGGAAVYAYCFREDAFARRRTRRVIGQFLPCLVAGAAATATLLRAGPNFIALLPGLWALLFGLGTFATRPYLPRAVGWVGLSYLAAGAFLLQRAVVAPALSPWAVGGVFGLGHLATAVVLHFNLERNDHA
jgi:hypothetical protein